MATRPVILTAGRLAQLVGVSNHLIRRWCDHGVLPCHRLQGCDDRRIRLEDALRVAGAWDLPMEGLEELARRHGLAPAAPPRVLLLSPCNHVPAELAAACCNVSLALDPFQAGHVLASQRFDALLLDHALGRSESWRICQWASERHPRMRIGCLLSEDDAALPAGAHLARQKPTDAAVLVADLLAVRDE